MLLKLFELKWRSSSFVTIFDFFLISMMSALDCAPSNVSTRLLNTVAYMYLWKRSP